MADFTSVFMQLQTMGVFEYLLPFLLIFTVIFAILEKLAILGKDKKNLNLMLALILGLLVVVQPEIVMLINSFLPKVSLFILVVLMFLVVAGMFGANTSSWTRAPFLIAIVVCILAIIWALSGSSYLGMPYWLKPSEQDKAWIILIVTVVLVITYIGGGQRQESGIDKIVKGLQGK
ncbi:MAG: hypothetical protein PHF86_09215 [Candidatus Nanoarchaeia archaeon]|nr:hypothetical protein [Candidatus Nanoarchaeia archaeon]